MKKKLLLSGFICSIFAIAAFAYSRGDIVKASDSCGCCKHNGPVAFTCGQCGRGFSRVIEIKEGDNYDVLEFSHKGHHEYETCQHSMTAYRYK